MESPIKKEKDFVFLWQNLTGFSCQETINLVTFLSNISLNIEMFIHLSGGKVILKERSCGGDLYYFEICGDFWYVHESGLFYNHLKGLYETNGQNCANCLDKLESDLFYNHSETSCARVLKNILVNSKNGFSYYQTVLSIVDYYNHYF